MLRLGLVNKPIISYWFENISKYRHRILPKFNIEISEFRHQIQYRFRLVQLVRRLFYFDDILMIDILKLTHLTSLN